MFATIPSTEPYALVVQDDGLIQMVACQILADAGFRTYDANTPDDALPLLSAWHERITLLFTDVYMPGSISGFDLAREVDRRWPHIAIVVASGRSRPEPGDMPDKAAFIHEPFSPQLVESHLRRILPNGRKPDPLKRAV